jgi:hypothetical protein
MKHVISALADRNCLIIFFEFRADDGFRLSNIVVIGAHD